MPDNQENKDLERCMNRAEAIRQELERFVYVVTHDLRAPLRAITHLAQWIEKDMGENIPEEVTKNMDLLKGRVGRMDFLFQALLRYSRTCRDGLTIQEAVPMDQLVKDAVHFSGAEKAFEVKISDMEFALDTDPKALELVFQEVLDNAVKFAGQGKSLDIWAEQNDEAVVFHIRDAGPGIPEEHQEDVFEVFRTLTARDTDENAGVGLALARKVVRLAGGLIRVHPEASGAWLSFSWRREIPSESLQLESPA